MKVSSSLSHVAVIRGGNINIKDSISSGADILATLKSLNYKVLDVLIDSDESWSLHGTPTDPHTVFSKSHTVVDTTRAENKHYHDLARKMGINIIFSNENLDLDREDIYRLLRQNGIKVPDTYVVRSKKEFKNEFLKEIWSKFHLPLLIRPTRRQREAKSKMVKSFNELEEEIIKNHSLGIDSQIMTYRSFPISSVAIIPNFREESLYTPLLVESFPNKHEVPNENTPKRVFLNAPSFRKEAVSNFVKKVYKELGLKGLAVIDIIPHRDDYMVVHVETNPSLRKEGRFLSSLNTTGVTLGEIVDQEIKRNL